MCQNLTHCLPSRKLQVLASLRVQVLLPTHSTKIAAINYCKTLEAGVESDKEVYIKGKVVNIKEQFSTNFGNGSFYIADDETSEKFYIFRSLYLGNKKWTASDPELKEGDEVVVCAKVMNYMGNTPETVANKTYLVS